MKLHKLILTAIAGSLFLASCSGDDNGDNKPSGAYDNGVLVLNQGKFNGGNASVSFLSDNFAIENNIFGAVNNNALLGDTAQDIGFNGDLAYIVVNVSNKIEVVNRYTFVKVATINTGLVNPRYITFHNGKGYVTNWGDGTINTDDYVAVIDLASNAITGNIPVAEGPEKIIEENGKLYVAHAGGFGFGKTVTVIKTADNTIETTIEVGDIPNSIEVENGKLYVISSGLPSYAETETPGELNVIDLSNNTVAKTINFTGTSHPSNLIIENDKIYYVLNNGIYNMAIAASALPTAPLFTTASQGAYAISCFELEDNKFYLGDAADYNSNGKIYVYTADGSVLYSTTVGVAPSGFYFND